MTLSHSEVQKRYRERHLDDVRKSDAQRHRDAYDPEKAATKFAKEYHAVKDKFFEMYGNRCACCGEAIIEFLTIEHLAGQVGKKVKDTGYRAYRQAIKEYRPDLYAVLCLNCNHAIGRFGMCPHQKVIYEQTKQTTE